MKKLFVLLVVTVFALNVVAQEAAKAPAAKMDNKMGDKMKDCVMMKDGKMWMWKDGKNMAMDKDMTMKNGNMVMMNGSVTMKDGSKMMMKNGQCMDMEGNMMPMNKPMHKKMSDNTEK